MNTAGLIEAWGRGYERIRDGCQSAGTPEPNVEHDGAGLWMKWAWRTPEVTPKSPPKS
jgi:hypothetical protein